MPIVKDELPGILNKTNLFHTNILISTCLKIIFTFYLLFFALSTAFGQKKLGKNLVPNPGFETHKNKSKDISNAVPWVGVGTVDYYMKIEKRDTSRFKGAHSGECYAGLRFQKKYKEFMYVRLLEPLEKDKVYHFKMYIRLLNNANVTMRVKQLGVYFSEEIFNSKMT